MNIILTDKELTAGDTALDTLALSLKQWTEDEVYFNASDYDSEVMNYILKEYNYEKAFIKMLNDNPQKLLELIPHEESLLKKFEEGNLLAGAFFALELPEQFANKLEDWTDEIKDNAWQYQDQPELLPEDLVKEITESMERYYKDQVNEWIYGSRDYAGILRLAEKEYECTDVRYNNGILEFEFDRGEAEFFLTSQVYEYSSEEAEKMSDKKVQTVLKKSLAEVINRLAGNYIFQQQEANRKNREERERVKEYQAKRKEEAELERRNKLLAMTKN